MFTYFGSKARNAKHYPPPSRRGVIIEPFAGSARYSVHWGMGREVLLVEKNPVVARIWRWIFQCRPADIAALPDADRLKPDVPIVKQVRPWEAAAFIVARVSAPYRDTMTDGVISRFKMPSIKPDKHWKHLYYAFRRCARLRAGMDRWRIIEGDYTAAGNTEASWFIDPPYRSFQRTYANYDGRDIDYGSLARWCQSRIGRVVVCEIDGADWLPFRFFRRGTPNGYTAINSGRARARSEAIWTRGCDENETRLFPAW